MFTVLLLARYIQNARETEQMDAGAGAGVGRDGDRTYLGSEQPRGCQRQFW